MTSDVNPEPVRGQHRAVAVASVLTVLLAYTFFASTGTMEFRRVKWEDSKYADLTEGFLRGHLSLASEPTRELRALSDPYDTEVRNGKGVGYVWDASYFNGRYYLYFSALPVLIFYIPFYLAAGGYPSDSLVTLLFTAWALIGFVNFLIRARGNRRWHVPLAVWIIALGLGNLIPYVLTSAYAYQVAISCCMAMTSMWACSLVAYLRRPSARHAAYIGLWCGLAIAARPNVAVLVLVSAVAMFRVTPREERRRSAVAWLLPLAAIGLALMAYNFARFGAPLEFGVRYQLSSASMINRRLCSLCDGPELVRFFNMAAHHVLQPPVFGGPFPWVDLAWSHIDVSVTAGSEQAGGIVAIAPLTALATLLLLLRPRGAAAPVGGDAAARYLMLAASAILLSLATCWFVASRYSLDYAMLMIAASIILTEEQLDRPSTADVSRRRMRVLAITFTIYSIAVGTLLGFAGPIKAFEAKNPQLLERITRAFG